jgi:hypothetical protein
MRSKWMTFSTPHIGHLRHGLFFTRLDCQFNAKPSEKDHDLPRIRTWGPILENHGMPFSLQVSFFSIESSMPLFSRIGPLGPLE